MYNAFFGFTQNPFNMSPDPSFLFRSSQHEEALANLIYGVQSRKGFVLLSGEVGTGKTTMLECLRDFLHSQQIAFASLFNSRLTVEQFFELLAYDLELQCNRQSKTEVLLALNNMLLERAAWAAPPFSSWMKPTTWNGMSSKKSVCWATWKTAAASSCRSFWPGSRNWTARWKPRNSASSSSASPCAARCAVSTNDATAYINSRMARAGLNQTVFSAELMDEIRLGERKAFPASSTQSATTSC
jgi:type II secretory pathway predicted ATPase ExeA